MRIEYTSDTGKKRDLDDYVNENLVYTGMETTITAAVVQGVYVTLGHVGDSRAYVNEREITHITKDHSIVQKSMDKGELTKEKAQIHPQKNIITRVVGTYKDIEVDTFTEYVYRDNYLSLCGDGLTDMIPDEKIYETAVTNDDPQETCNLLVKKANDKGEFDNAVVLVQFNELPENFLSDKIEIRATDGGDLDETKMYGGEFYG